MAKATQSSHRADFDRNLSEAFFETLDRDPTLTEEMYFHRIRVSAEFIEFVNTSAVFSRLERSCRELFAAGNLALLECSPTDAAAVMDAQIKCMVAATLTTMISDAITDGPKATEELKNYTSNNEVR